MKRYVAYLFCRVAQFMFDVSLRLYPEKAPSKPAYRTETASEIHAKAYGEAFVMASYNAALAAAMARPENKRVCN